MGLFARVRVDGRHHHLPAVRQAGRFADREDSFRQTSLWWMSMSTSTRRVLLQRDLEQIQVSM